MNAGQLDRRARIERPIADDSFDGAGSGSWQLVAEVWAEVKDMLPSRTPAPVVPSNMARPARVRIRYREDVSPDMRFVLRGGRTLHIVEGPAEIGRRDGLEFIAAEYLPGGNAA